MKSTKLISSTLIAATVVFCTIFLTSGTTFEKSNEENIKQLTKEISNLQKEIKTLEANISKKNSMGNDVFIAEIVLFGGNFAPRGYMDCNGQLLPINSYQALFSLLGTMYGGDGRTTFALPNLNKKDSNGKIKQPRYIIAVQGIYPSRS